MLESLTVHYTDLGEKTAENERQGMTERRRVALRHFWQLTPTLSSASSSFFFFYLFTVHIYVPGREVEVPDPPPKYPVVRSETSGFEAPLIVSRMTRNLPHCVRGLMRAFYRVLSQLFRDCVRMIVSRNFYRISRTQRQVYS